MKWLFLALIICILTSCASHQTIDEMNDDATTYMAPKSLYQTGAVDDGGE